MIQFLHLIFCFHLICVELMLLFFNKVGTKWRPLLLLLPLHCLCIQLIIDLPLILIQVSPLMYFDLANIANFPSSVSGMNLARYSSILRALNSNTGHALAPKSHPVCGFTSQYHIPQQPLLESGSHPCPTTWNCQLLWRKFVEYVPKLPSYQAQLILDWMMTYFISILEKLFSKDTLKLIIPTMD